MTPFSMPLAIIAELTRVLAERFEWSEDDIEALLTPIVAISSPEVTARSCRQRFFLH